MIKKWKINDKKMKNWSQEKPGELKSQKCKKPRVFFILFIIFSFVYHLWFFICLSFVVSRNHQILPSVRHIFLNFRSKILQNIRSPWKSQRKWWEMIKKLKTNDKKMKNWSQEKPGELKSQKCKKPRVFLISYHFFICLSFFIIFLWFVENHQILPSVRYIFLIFWSKMLQNIRNPWKSQRKWWEMIKKWKINDKKIKNKW